MTQDRTEHRLAAFCNLCLADSCALCLGVLLTLVIRGYQYGQSNHTIYLLDALRVNDPRLLANDWFATHTYQYHFVFAHVTAWLMRLGVAQRAFFVGYLVLVVAWHGAWLRIARALGATRRAYLVSVLLFFLSAGGVGLGMYDFLQDASFLPSNVANVAMLWGICFWIIDRPALAGLLLGVAGFFHLNHAVVCIVLWFALLPFSGRADQTSAPSGRPVIGRLAGTFALLTLCLPNMIPAARVAMVSQHRMALEDFVNLYVRLRHPHHYDPSSWPVALWVSFLWPFPLGVLYARGAFGQRTVRRTLRVFLLLCGVVGFGLIFAGAWYVSETVVQMSLARFSIYLKLLSCIGAAIWVASRPFFKRLDIRAATLAEVLLAGPLAYILAHLMKRPETIAARTFLLQNGQALALLWITMLVAVLFALGMLKRVPVIAQLVIVLALMMTAAAHPRSLGLHFGFERPDPPEYVAVCEYAREHTPLDAVFLVPPQEEQFRLRAQRAIVVNFKGVPQFSGELVEWRHRLCDVLDVSSLTVLPHRFDRTLAAMADAYDQLPAQHLARVARLYRARYVVTSHPADFPPPARSVFESGNYHLYDLGP